jgi:hypothetical protein
VSADEISCDEAWYLQMSSGVQDDGELHLYRFLDSLGTVYKALVEMLKERGKEVPVSTQSSCNLWRAYQDSQQMGAC